ncbi:MAG: S8 family peptidase [Candidatus Dojkabacteria bacterium]|jgi:hypothetical protein|nr:S8 family peptidase [Candidatus Dojkabacteria bacterium]
MKQVGKKTLVLLGSGIVSLGIFLFVIVLGLLIPSGDLDTIDLDENAISSRYISESIPVLETEEEIEITDEIDLNKQGVLEVEEDRKVLKVDRILSQAQKESLEEKYDIKFTQDTDTNGVYVISISDTSDIQSLEAELKAVVETDIPVKMSADTVDWGVSRIGADKVWSTGSGTGIKIAVIDTGVQKDHPDLVTNLGTGYDFVNNDSDANDDNGHGTHVAGIATATLNQAGVVGVSNTSKIMPVKVLNAQGYGYLSDVAKGIYYAADNGARVINLSLGAPTDSSILKDAVNYATSKGVLIVAAAGNDSGAPCSYPASYSNVICVMATDSRNMLASFSNIGGELSAPGVYNYSTYIGSTYKYLSGTSMATPHVAGASALLFSICPTCTSSEIRSLLESTAIDLGEPGKDILFGYGLIDLTSAVLELQPEEEPTVPEDEDTQETPQEPVTETPTNKPTSPSKAPKRISQSISIVEPVVTKANKYIPTQVEDITVKYTLTPTLSDTTLESVTVYVDNDEIETSTNQTGEFIIPSELFNHSQHWIKTVAQFTDGAVSEAQVIVDMTYIKSVSRSTTKNNSKSVLGISFSIFDWFRFF